MTAETKSKITSFRKLYITKTEIILKRITEMKLELVLEMCPIPYSATHTSMIKQDIPWLFAFYNIRAQVQQNCRDSLVLVD